MDKTAITVESLLGDARWQAERRELRSIVLDFGLTETVKWGKLCYLFEERPVAIIFNQKEFCALGFPKGVLLTDETDALVAPGANSQSMRRLHFTSPSHVTDSSKLIRAFLQQAIDIERDGREIAKPAKDELTLPDELLQVFASDQEYAEAFDQLTPGRKRSYVIHFNASKRQETRTNRITKARDRVLKGNGQLER
ncbi:YdeI/OmpD-associated family protein [Asticcacaulis sp. W401b]|uniref:YdeI/OmpD-associated family protein n=1 Tax=Asticcacaulis sp. W401b TaxID=3388666 RepID=UPI0039707BBE